MTKKLSQKAYSITPFSLDLENRVKWLIKLRWFVIGGIIFAVLLSTWLFEILPHESYLPLNVAAVFLIVYNIFLSIFPNWISNAKLNIFLQACFDLVILTLLLHFSGGLENPFFFMYLFHPLLAWMLLPEKESYAITIITCLLFLLLAFGELTGFFGHYLIKTFPHGLATHGHASHDPYFVLSITTAFLLIMGGTTFFHTSIIKELRHITEKTIQAGKMAALGELAGSIAHEVNNPIGIISAKAKILLSGFENGKLPEKVLSDIEKIDKHADRITTLVKGLLAFSRPSIGQKSLLNINKIVQDTISLFENKLSAQNIKTKLTLFSSPLQIMGNFNELQQILVNLINNAIDAMPNGGELVVESTVSNNEKQKFASVSIKDTGKGIPSDILPKIFEPFFTTKSEGKGTGLGLSISLGHARAHGGFLEAQSELGKGAYFILKFPMEY